ncbi:hypothetical protein LRS10_03915 [Phenylobacterium sp. J426]|uniref:hypothetical protein n=1 Tax=Phenylobacterium sp. J426 TaxID=2898439 RepID=UPI0021516D6B|nr:hypothetical protein [Phenylobacterium sp. J426]MCR5873412.1 hypothetical protein [Phenylobacterium sp. J426]
MSRIDRIRRVTQVGGLVRADQDPHEGMDEPKIVRLPAVAPAAKSPPSGDGDPGAVFTAQLIGQDGQKRGLRAGPLHIEAARGAYNKVEWSGSKDRRARAGRNAKTEI